MSQTNNASIKIAKPKLSLGEQQFEQALHDSPAIKRPSFAFYQGEIKY